MARLLLNAYSLATKQGTVTVLILPEAAVHGDALIRHLSDIELYAKELHSAILVGSPGFFVCLPLDPTLQIRLPWDFFPDYKAPSLVGLWKWLWAEEQLGR